MGIMAHSWEPVWTMSLIALFFGIGAWADAVRKAKRDAGENSPFASTVLLGQVTILIAVLVAGVGLTAERVYLVNGDSYPAFLTSRDLGTSNDDGLLKLTNAVCKQQPGEIFRKAGNLTVIRCGMLWYQGQTFTTHVVNGDTQS